MKTGRINPEARLECFNRSNGICQFCGTTEAREGHHWALKYDYGNESPDDLVALCTICHSIATSMRRMHRKKYNMFDFMQIIRKAIKQLKSGEQIREKTNDESENQNLLEKETKEINEKTNDESESQNLLEKETKEINEKINDEEISTKLLHKKPSKYHSIRKPMFMN